MKKPPSKEQESLQESAGKEARSEHKKDKQKQLRPIHNKTDRKAHDPYREWPKVSLPDNFCLTDNYEQVVIAISEIRTRIGKKKYINFNTIREMDIAAALMLAAELEVSKIQSKTSQMMAHDSNWDPKVRTLLGQMGFLELLAANSKISPHTEPSKNQIFLKFRSGHKLIGDDTMQMLKNLQKHFAHYDFDPEFLLNLYAGIFEAITNTCHHAYRSKRQDKELKRWWISASVNTETNEITVVCYDRGATIPKTVKPETFFSSLRSIFQPSSDGKIILAALENKTTSTNLTNRGKGLSELLRLIDRNNQGLLRIYSGEGLAELRRSAPNEENSNILHKLPRKMRGTLVEWSIIPSRSTMETHQNGITP